MSRKQFLLPILVLLICLLIMPMVSCGAKSDEDQVKDLLKRGTEAWNEKDFPTLYEMYSPNYRKTASYEEFKEYAKAASGLLLLFLGPGKLEITDISVRIEGEWAYASYKIVKEGEVIDFYEGDIFRKVKGKWYDVAEDPMNPGYNEEDLPSKRRGAGLWRKSSRK